MESQTSKSRKFVKACHEIVNSKLKLEDFRYLTGKYHGYITRTVYSFVCKKNNVCILKIDGVGQSSPAKRDFKDVTFDLKASIE